MNDVDVVYVHDKPRRCCKVHKYIQYEYKLILISIVTSPLLSFSLLFLFALLLLHSELSFWLQKPFKQSIVDIISRHCSQRAHRWLTGELLPRMGTVLQQLNSHGCSFWVRRVKLGQKYQLNLFLMTTFHLIYNSSKHFQSFVACFNPT